MAQVQTSAAALRIIGDDLIPDEITKLLGSPPTVVQKKGDKITGKKTENIHIAKSGMWRLFTRDRKPENLDGQIEEILGQLTPDLAVWQSIAKRFRTELFCGLFMDETNEGLIISAKSLAALGARGIELQLDVYGPTENQSIGEAWES